MNSACGLAGERYPAGALIPLFQHGVAMRGCTWAALVFMEVVQLTVKFTRMPGPETDHMIIVIHSLCCGFKSSGQFRGRAVSAKPGRNKNQVCVTFPKILRELVIASAFRNAEMQHDQKTNLDIGKKKN